MATKTPMGMLAHFRTLDAEGQVYDVRLQCRDRSNFGAWSAVLSYDELGLIIRPHRPHGLPDKEWGDADYVTLIPWTAVDVCQVREV